jgi:hypothetical protein
LRPARRGCTAGLEFGRGLRLTEAALENRRKQFAREGEGTFRQTKKFALS